MRVVTKWLKIESRDFRYKVALYLSYLRIKFYDEIRRESLRISSIISYYYYKILHEVHTILKIDKKTYRINTNRYTYSELAHQCL